MMCNRAPLWSRLSSFAECDCNSYDPKDILSFFEGCSGGVRRTSDKWRQ